MMMAEQVVTLGVAAAMLLWTHVERLGLRAPDAAPDGQPDRQ
jgi:hypothetical protein